MTTKTTQSINNSTSTSNESGNAHGDKTMPTQPNSEKKTSSQLVKRLIILSVAAQAAGFVLIWLFQTLFYSIIFLLGTIISLSGFIVMTKMIDRVLRRGKGQPIFFLVVLFKLAVIGGAFYLVSLSSKPEPAVLHFLLGISVIVIAIFMEAAIRIYRSVVNGRA